MYMDKSVEITEIEEMNFGLKLKVENYADKYRIIFPPSIVDRKAPLAFVFKIKK